MLYKLINRSPRLSGLQAFGCKMVKVKAKGKENQAFSG